MDLGATSGRVILGRFASGTVELETVHRFANDPIQMPDGLHWDIQGLWRNVLEGLRAAYRREPELAGVAVDSWAVDYALMAGQRMLGVPFHYRDERTLRGVQAVSSKISPAGLYARNGLQAMSYNTVYQLATEGEILNLADGILLIPDLMSFWLTGVRTNEWTNASTTGLMSPATRTWDLDLVDRLGMPRRVFGGFVNPGDRIGDLRPAVVEMVGGPLTVSAVASHDTASAVLATPLVSRDSAYLSLGTWGLVGLELDAPVVSDEARLGSMTNEGGVDGRTRFLRNVMGTWLLSESMRTWERAGRVHDLPGLLAAAGDVTREVAVFDASDPRFMAPGDLPARIRDWCVEHDVEPPRDEVETVRSIVESLAHAFADAIAEAGRLSGRAVDVIHVVGGGSQNTLLCRRLAEVSGRPVLAGPVEATALGNVLVQGRTLGWVEGGLDDLRQIVAASVDPVRYQPTS